MSKGTILIVDDSEHFRSIIRYVLETFGYQVLEAKNGVEALTILRQQHSIKLVVSDVNMPEMDGLELVEHISKIDSSVPVILVTGDLNSGIQEKAIRLGVQACLQKPFSIAVFHRTVKQFL